MKWTIIIAGIIALIIVIVIVIGYSLPVKHTASVQTTINASPDRVWERLTDIGKYPSWRKDIKSVEVLSDTEWIEVNNHNDKLPLKIISNHPPDELVTHINSTTLPFGGNWVFKLSGSHNETVVTITENGEIFNPFFRFVSRFILGYSITIKKYSYYLERSFK